jgi:hypothetical protein
MTVVLLMKYKNNTIHRIPAAFLVKGIHEGNVNKKGAGMPAPLYYL